MADVLYRKYRPRSFAEVHGQEMIVKTIQYAFVSGKHSHAYLLVGPRGTGKTTLARLMAKAANCLNLAEAGDVCNDCDACTAIDKGSFSDVIEIDAASNRGIDEIRQLRDSINFLPAEGKMKVYVIDEVHMLTKEAFNALLKTLEEPPAHAMFVLATTEPHKVPITISSRLQRFDLSLAKPEQLLAKLRQIVVAEGVEVGDDVLELIYEHTEGSYRDAESLLGKILAVAGDDGKVDLNEVSKLIGVASLQLVNDLTGGLLQGSRVESTRNIDAALAQGVDLLQLAKQVANNLRKALHTDGSAIDRQFLKIINGLVQLQADARVIDDMRLLWDVFILNVCSDQTEVANNVSSQSPRPAPKFNHSDNFRAKDVSKAAKQKDNSKDNQESDVPQDAITLGSEPFSVSQFLDRSRDAGFKLQTILRGCNFEANGTMLVITTMFDYNYKFLQQPSNQVQVQRLAAVYGLDRLEVKKVDTVEIPSFAEEPESESVEIVVESNADLVESML